MLFFVIQAQPTPLKNERDELAQAKFPWPRFYLISSHVERKLLPPCPRLEIVL